MKWHAITKLGLELPGVEEGLSYGTPALKVRGKLLARLKDDGLSVVFMLENVDEQEFLIAARPKLYFITDHYRGYAAVLARLAALRTAECRERLEDAWRDRAPKALVKEYDRQR